VRATCGASSERAATAPTEPNPVLQNIINRKIRWVFDKFDHLGHGVQFLNVEALDKPLLVAFLDGFKV